VSDLYFKQLVGFFLLSGSNGCLTIFCKDKNMVLRFLCSRRISSEEKHYLLLLSYNGGTTALLSDISLLQYHSLPIQGLVLVSSTVCAFVVLLL
jgi:hypothetical protein